MPKSKEKKKSFASENVDAFRYLTTLSPAKQKAFIKQADRSLLLAISEICLNVMNKRYVLSPTEKKKLQPYREQILALSQKKPSLKLRKKKLQTGGFLGALVGTLIPALIGTIVEATRK